MRNGGAVDRAVDGALGELDLDVASAGVGVSRHALRVDLAGSFTESVKEARLSIAARF